MLSRFKEYGSLSLTCAPPVVAMAFRTPIYRINNRQKHYAVTIEQVPIKSILKSKSTSTLFMFWGFWF